MKTKIYSKILILMLVCVAFFNNKTNAQGVDVIFWMDHSLSIDAGEYNNMVISTNNLIDEVLGCNPSNRVSVVAYGATNNDPATSNIWIHSNFTNNATTAKGYSRRTTELGYGDFAHESLAVIGDALDGTINTHVLSPQKTLNKNAANRLVIFLFTDGWRDYGSAGSSALINQTVGGAPFENYNLFKTARGAQFVVLHATTGVVASDLTARPAAAAIASTGGVYSGSVEANVGDPQGSGTTPRKMFTSGTFTISPSDLALLELDICRSCVPLVTIAPVTPPSQTVCQNAVPDALEADATGTGTLSYQWYSNITNSTTGGTLIPGATSDIYTPLTTTTGTQYYYVEVIDTNCDGKATSSVVSVTVSNTGSCAPCAASAGTLN